MKNKGSIVKVLILVLIFSVLAISCTARTQVRWQGDENLGALPEDMSYDQNGIPRIITVSSESDGDMVMSYLNNKNQVVAQLYGCPAIGLCTNLQKQGRYYWTIPSR
jgi:hypothetical protein